MLLVTACLHRARSDCMTGTDVASGCRGHRNPSISLPQAQPRYAQLSYAIPTPAAMPCRFRIGRLPATPSLQRLMRRRAPAVFDALRCAPEEPCARWEIRHARAGNRLRGRESDTMQGSDSGLDGYRAPSRSRIEENSGMMLHKKRIFPMKWFFQIHRVGHHRAERFAGCGPGHRGAAGARAGHRSCRHRGAARDRVWHAAAGPRAPACACALVRDGYRAAVDASGARRVLVRPQRSRNRRRWRS